MLRRQLGGELRTARSLAGLTQRELAATLETSQASIVRVERGVALLSREATQSWLLACGVAETVRDRVLVLAEAAHSETWSWAEPLGGEVTHLQGVARDRERSARTVRNYQAMWIPGLLQTAGYAQALLPQVDPTGRMDHAAAVAARLERQQALYEPGRRFEFLIEENALRWMPGPKVRAGQMDRLLTVATLETVEIGVLRIDRVGAAGWHSFTLFEPEEGPPYVTTELLHGGQVVVDPADVSLYQELWDQLSAAAVTGDAAVSAIKEVA